MSDAWDEVIAKLEEAVAANREAEAASIEASKQAELASAHLVGLQHNLGELRSSLCQECPSLN